MKKKLLLGLILFTGVLNAQTEFRSGYIVKQNLDTIYGEIDYRSDAIMRKVCKFKKEEEIIKYSPKDIKTYKFIDGKYFVSKVVKDEAVFLEFLVKGKLNIYCLYDAEGNKYFLENEEGGLREVPITEKQVNIDGVFYSKKSTVHYGVLSTYTKEAPELKREISNMNVLNHRNMISLAKNYHNAVCDTEECIVYTETSRKVHFNAELIGGVLMFTEEYPAENSFQTGVLLHVSLPSLGDKWYVKTGVQYSRLKYSHGDDNFFRFPINIEYIHFKGLIRPRFSYGFGLTNMSFMSTSFDLGINIRATEKIFISLGSEILFTGKYLIIPDTLYAFGLNGGVFFNL